MGTAQATSALADVDVSPSRARGRLLLFTLIVFFGYGAIGLPLAALPNMVHNTLGFSTPVVGFAVALQSLATLLTRPLTGRICDTKGGKPSVILGIICFIASGLLYLISVLMPAAGISLSALLLGRVAAGFGESFAVTGTLAWCIASIGPQNTGRTMVWIGIAMYGAVAVGAPAGLFLEAKGGFLMVALGAILLPVAAAAIAASMLGMKGPVGARLPFHRVLGLIWRQGLGLALGSIGFGSLISFVTLYFQSQHWDGAGATLGACGSAYILTRLVAGHLPDRFGGTKVAVASLAIESAGLLLLFFASSPFLAIVGSVLTGAGFALVFPSMGIVAVRRVPAANRGSALGGYVAFFDIGLAVSGPRASSLQDTAIPRSSLRPLQPALSQCRLREIDADSIQTDKISCNRKQMSDVLGL